MVLPASCYSQVISISTTRLRSNGVRVDRLLVALPTFSAGRYNCHAICDLSRSSPYIIFTDLAFGPHDVTVRDWRDSFSEYVDDFISSFID